MATPLLSSLLDSADKNPRRYDIWMRHEDNSFSVEDSTLDANGRKDPWSRELPSNFRAHRDRDNDITHWTGSTTIAGKVVRLTIWND